MSINNNMKKFDLFEGKHDPNIFKAIIMIGGPGSGKSFITKSLAAGTGLKIINPDIFLEYFAKKQDIDIKTILKSENLPDYRFNAHQLKNKQMNYYLNQHLGLIIDVTGRNYAKIIHTTNRLKTLGYDIILIYVKTDLETAIIRNKGRERALPDDVVAKLHTEVNENIEKFEESFGENFHIIENSTDSDTYENINSLWAIVNKFINSPIKNAFYNNVIKKRIGL